jgi:hypothetical protein
MRFLELLKRPDSGWLARDRGQAESSGRQGLVGVEGKELGEVVVQRSYQVNTV